MRRIVKSITCFLLIFIILVSSYATVFAYTTDDIVRAALVFIYESEGTYTSVVSNDNGAVSMGKIGWHASRALYLMKMIVNANPSQAKEILGEDFYNEIITASDTSWNSRVFTASEKAAAEKLLATDESKKAQDELSYNDIKGYIDHARSLGITDGKALVYFADLENQMGANGAERVAVAAAEAAGSMSKVTLSVLYNAAMADRTAGSSPTRRRNAYNYCNSLNLDAPEETGKYKTGQYRIATQSDPLRIRSGPGTTYSTLGVSVPKGTIVTVTQISGDWGKITYGGVTGWIFLVYTTYIGESSSGSVRGDVNGNGKTDASDARLALRAAASLITLDDAQKKRADMDGDGKVTAKDARTILRIAAKLE